ncbi:NADPH:quinone reductase [Rhizobiales bacterium GAS191]|nr:NADPH:quinone reductase [Rhizobiales bacterium GAS191]
MTLAERQTQLPADAVEASCVRLDAKASEVEAIDARLERLRLARTEPADALVEIGAAAVNPSDVKAAIGMMPYAVFPRTPGRDFAGTVIAGPSELLGVEVFGSSGDLGIRRDGTHATHLVVEAQALVRKPANIGLAEAAGIGVPFVTALEGYRRAGMPKPGEIVLIMGLNGKVGQAAAQIAAWRGATVIGVVRKAEPYAGHASAPVAVIDASAGDVAARLREITGGKGADIVFNTVGDPYFQDAHRSLAVLGRQILIAAVDKLVQFNIFEFYRGRHTYVGVDTLALSSVAAADILRELAPGFASGELKPFPIEKKAVFALAEAKQAYEAVMASSRDRVILDPKR